MNPEPRYYTPQEIGRLESWRWFIYCVFCLGAGWLLGLVLPKWVSWLCYLAALALLVRCLLFVFGYYSFVCCPQCQGPSCRCTFLGPTFCFGCGYRQFPTDFEIGVPADICRILSYASVVSYFGAGGAPFTWTRLLVHISMALFFQNVSAYLSGVRQAQNQWQRDQDAREIARRKALETRGDDLIEPFSLYARPFSFDGKLQTENPAHAPAFMLSRYWLEDASAEIEAELGRAIWPELLVGLGTKDRMSPGAGRIRSPHAKWRREFKKLLAQCRRVFVVAAGRRNVLWEVLYVLRRGSSPKAIFVMPRVSDHPEKIREEWEHLRARIHRFGVEIPEYNEDGALFTMTAEGKVIRMVTFPKHSFSGLAALIQELLPAALKESSPAKECEAPVQTASPNSPDA